MAPVMFIDVWSDVVCPFCYLGSEQLRLAVEQFAHREDVVVRARAFELDPRAPRESTLNVNELLVRKYAMTLEQARGANDRLVAQARQLGLDWDMERARPVNTFDAHRLIAQASTQGRAPAMVDRLFRAYFSEGLVVSDRATLSTLADEVGVEGAARLWSGDDYSGEVRDDENAASELGITGVPSFLVDQRFMVVGAQGTAQLLDVLDRAWRRRDSN